MKIFVWNNTKLRGTGELGSPQQIIVRKQGRTSDYQFPIFATPVTTEKLERINKSERAILSFEF